MSERIVSFVMSGGVGSRLWPLSRQDNPKQFHDLSGDGSMLAKTLRRLTARPEGETPIFLIAAERHAERVHADLAGLDLAGGGPLFEPTGRNTAAAVALAALRTLSEFGDSLVLVVPSDHEIATPKQFWQSVEAGSLAALSGRLVVFGIKPTQPETGYGYIEVAAESGGVFDVSRFVEKPDLATAQSYLSAGTFYWNTGIFLFRASAMRDAFAAFQPDIWQATQAAYKAATSDLSGLYMPLDLYAAIPSNSIDYAIMERAKDIVMVPAGFRWNDLGSWQSLLDVGPADANGNVVVGDVVAIDCENSYIRSDGRLLSAIGMKDVAIVSTADATFVAPVSHSQHVKKIVEQLEKSGRLETRFTPAHDRVIESGAWRRRVHHWLFEETLPLWSTSGVDERHGGFHEALGFDGNPLLKPKRMRTTARQVYAFAVARARGWDGPADRLISHGIAFMAGKGRTERGGWVRTLNVDGSVADPTEDAYDHSCVLLALAHAHMCGNPDALRLGQETFVFLDAHLEDSRMTGFLETSDGEGERRSNPHMHLLEAFLAWYKATGDRTYLRRAARIIDLFRSHFFDAESWTLGEYFDAGWKPAAGEKGTWTEPGHHFEWASLLTDFVARSGQGELSNFARKLYASAIANGLNRATGLAYGAVSRQGLPLDLVSRSWPQAEAIKAAIALDGSGGPDLKPEIEARVGRLFRWHIDPAPLGLWIDRIDERGRSLASDVPASIFYHLVCALTQYLDGTAQKG
ncbi:MULTISPECIES: mannose-1-phosphate guanylyltransferase/mannose-6-phosphate isomerase [unclassified Mesorhizobium]|uniref:mannose-1-phosphate guanylyltransferase/mannose-6-phosphate isomerase n=1 Tax=unclassified Mesorhizobium TaxID=325217 RepID=UPI0003CED3AB|nr:MULTISPECIES: mannose-1-phosphate guanylyltransferase/mannose-6-phosphate isomerase [unclassified Mesorhizobium]ESX96166.1 mannose-1-phosphate guanylyltransferase [Mesorhizobium sp. LNJC403B00]ESY06004.1 mannose-1-phosphate guanylyltransferase [Mesorhizobium sp. LNJC399B00]ESY12133.1 mannose-1-phosphate guanylyltransferase [Mesorhizobium sp. LNJC398B00]ESY32975.1 mannose-1-phosphate guanylyltransferase [Mesorhizobium sp. LNJC386A00]WJI68170.1 mannose-1-phosphate guanylyltransferase/mannose-